MSCASSPAIYPPCRDREFGTYRGYYTDATRHEWLVRIPSPGPNTGDLYPALGSSCSISMLLGFAVPPMSDLPGTGSEDVVMTQRYLHMDLLIVASIAHADSTWANSRKGQTGESVSLMPIMEHQPEPRRSHWHRQGTTGLPEPRAAALWNCVLPTAAPTITSLRGLTAGHVVNRMSPQLSLTASRIPSDLDPGRAR